MKKIPIILVSTLLAISLSAETNTVSKPAGIVRIQLPADSETLLSTPFLAFDPDINALFLDQLTGTTNETLADAIRKWDFAAQLYTNAYKADFTGDPSKDGRWFTDFSTWTTSTLSFLPGDGFWIRSSQTQDVYLSGTVILDATGTVTFMSGLNLFGYPFSSSLPLNSSRLKDSGAFGASPFTNADTVSDIIGGNYEQSWLLNNTNSAKNGKWVDLSTNLSATTLSLGRGYWYRRVPTNGFTWAEARPYGNPFPSNDLPPVISGMALNSARDEVTLAIETLGVPGESLDVFYKDLLSTNIFSSTGWNIAAERLPTTGSILQWTDAGSATRPKINQVYARFYLAGRGDIDHDGDGVPDAEEIFAYGTDPFHADGYHNLPFIENFEANTVLQGDINGQNGWTATPADSALVETGTVYEGSQALGIADATASHLFSATNAVVWADFYLQVIAAETPTSPANSAIAMFFNVDGQLVVQDGANGWKTLTNQPPLAAGSWARLTAKLDYTQQKWLICVNSRKYAENLGFNVAAGQFTRFSITGKTGYTDALHISVTEPTGLFIDNANFPDSWQMQYFGALGHSASADPDNDGLNNLQEYLLGTDPTNPDTDQDGVPDGLEVQWGRNPLAADIIPGAPFIEDFETNTCHLGEINGQNGWISSTPGSFVQTGTVVEGSQALELGGSTVTHFFSATNSTTVWVDSYLQVQPAAAPIGALTCAVVFIFNAEGYLVVGDGTNGWVTLTNTLFEAGTWVRLTTKLDYSAQRWQIYADGVSLAESLGFSGSVTSFSRYAISGDKGCLDSFQVTAAQPSLQMPKNISGHVTYSGMQTGAIHVVAVTSSDSWDTAYSVVLSAPGVFTIAGVPNATNYWLKAFRDSNGNLSNDSTEAWGVSPSNPIYIMSSVTNADIVLADLDIDENGLPDWWEFRYFGSTGQDPNADPDRDGSANIDEYRSGTDPTSLYSHGLGTPDQYPPLPFFEGFERNVGTNTSRTLLTADGSSHIPGDLGDRSIFPVAVSLDTVVVGSPGTLYIYGRQDSGWVQELKWTDREMCNYATNIYFAQAVDVSGNRALAGSTFGVTYVQDENNNLVFVYCGWVKVFEKHNGSWSMTAKLYPSDLITMTNASFFSEFGASVAVSDDLIAVGAPGFGHVYIYRFSGTNWREEAKLTGYACRSLAWDAGRLAVGCADGAFIFSLDNATNWSLEVSLVPTGGVLLAGSVGISGNRVVLGDPGNAGTAGSVSVFKMDSGSNWTQETTLRAPDGGLNDRFGKSVAIDGNMIVAGSYQLQSAYVFKWTGSEWQEQGVLTTDDEFFGDSVAVDRGTFLVRASSCQYGRVYVYELDGTSAGTIDGQRGWMADFPTMALVQDNEIRGGEQALQMLASTNPVSVRHLFALQDEAAVWEDYYLRPVRRQASGVPVLPSTATSAYYVDSDGRLVVCDGTGGSTNWITLTNHPSMATSTWARITVKQDFVNQKWSLWLNGKGVAPNLGFAHPAPCYGFFELTGEEDGDLYVDDISITAERPTDLLDDNDRPKLAVYSRFGTSNPGAGIWTNDYGAVIVASISPVTVGGTQYVSTGWIGTGSVPATGSGTNTGAFVLTVDSTLTWLWPDADTNGLPDPWEMQYFGVIGRSPTDDPDQDGLSNLQEWQYDTNPTNADTDADFLADGWEVDHGYDPTNPADGLGDPDQDGIPTGWEIMNGLDPFAGSEVSNNLVGWWEFEDYYPVDSSGHGHDGNVVNMSSLEILEAFPTGYGWGFGRTSAVEVTSDVSLAPTNGFTITAWLCATNTESPRYVVSKGTSYSLYDGGDGGTNLTFSINNGANVISAGHGTDVWFHVAAVYDGAAREMKLYIDGELQVSANSVGSLTTNGTGLVLGNWDLPDWGFGWQGLIGDLRLYDTALSAGSVGGLAEATQNSENGLSRSQQYWRDDSSANVAVVDPGAWVQWCDLSYSGTCPKLETRLKAPRRCRGQFPYSLWWENDDGDRTNTIDALPKAQGKYPSTNWAYEEWGMVRVQWVVYGKTNAANAAVLAAVSHPRMTVAPAQAYGATSGPDVTFSLVDHKRDLAQTTVTWRLDPTPTDGTTITPNASRETASVKPGTNSTTYKIIADCSYGHSATSQVRIVRAEMVPDFNHDRVIDNSDRGQATSFNPFRFWVNDDDDKEGAALDHASAAHCPGSTSYTLSYSTAHPSVLFETVDGMDNHVDGISDLVDFFPVWLNIGETVTTLPSDYYTYWLSQEDADLNCVFTGLTPDEVTKYLTDVDTANSLANATAYTVFRVKANWVQIPPDFLASAHDHGVILLEGRAATTAPLKLHVLDASGAEVLGFELPLSISSVTDMFRCLNLRPNCGDNRTIPGLSTSPMGNPSNNPDALSNGKNVVFIHGFNETPASALGNICETFKRLYWSGSRAKFTGVEWFGDSSFPTATHYHEDVVNAFATAPSFANLVTNTLQGQEVNVIAFSLGNMVVSSAIQDQGACPSRYFMLHAAMAKEAYDATAYDADMRQIEWRDYTNRLYASKWHELFPSGDGRSELKWLGRFASVVATNTYNYYSSGDDVLADLTAGWVTPSVLEHVISEGRYAWCVQELFKGRHVDWLGGSWYGGWEFNHDSEYGHMSSGSGDQTPSWIPIAPSSAEALDAEQLKTRPFFKPSTTMLGVLDTTPLYQYPDDPSGTGSLFARQEKPRLLAEMIPALSFATGRNEVNALSHNINMQQTTDSNGHPVGGFQNGWPVGRGTPQDWLHGDYKTVAYVCVYEVFDDIAKMKGYFNQ